MVDSEVGGVLMESMCCMGWCSRNSLGGVGRSFLVLLDLKWGTTSRLVFGMMYGGGYCPLSERIRSCVALPTLGMLPWQIIFSFPMTFLNGMLILLEQHMIGSWNSLFRSSISCTPSNGDGMV
jgi:hypothetical protein